MILSVILPMYNEAQDIARVISAVAQVFSDEATEGEVIAVNDNSPDGTAAIALGLSGSCPVAVRVRVNPQNPNTRAGSPRGGQVSDLNPGSWAIPDAT